VVVTHDMGTAFKVSDRLAMIGKGRMLLVADKEDFRTTTRRDVRDFIEGNAPESEDLAALLSSS
jgi:phospholipid/cholesterol/gamma-HCH transport system ATP-binding protein